MTRLFDAKPFIIAEVGSNWTSFQEAKDSISAAKQCGADAVKFQLFDDSALYGAGVMDATYSGVLNNHKLPVEWLPKLKEKADACGIEFMCTAFSPEFVRAVDPFVSVHKVASSDLSDPHMLNAVKEAGKPVILSCGASSRGDINIAVNGHPELSWGGFGDHKLVLLYCNSAYPSRRHNLFLMDELQKFGRPVGLSDHSTDVIYAPLSAFKHFGAVVIEKHFTIIPEKHTPDMPHSLTTDEFKIMCDYLHGKRDGGGLNPTSEEKSMFLRHNRRLIAIKDINQGDRLKYGVNYGAYRSLEDDSRGMIPFLWDKMEGRSAKSPIAIGKGIAIEDINL